ncbi:uncharacterized protein LOC132169274 [Corylus avellana]|uniref:uncharacterized protein LOC132169274 n=1 Tax=Corylus avellana TaxID=13451 RepID=UPI00286A47D1|nr:uncharacterized protein LOC132169274 [Corylus avellana]
MRNGASNSKHCLDHKISGRFSIPGLLSPFRSKKPPTLQIRKSLSKDQKKKDKKALYLHHQGFDDSTFEKVAEATTSKAAWDTFNTIFKAIEESKDLELLGSLRVHEQLILKNASATFLEQALESKLNFDKPKGGRGQWNSRRGGANYCGRGRGQGHGNTNDRGPSQERRNFSDRKKQNVQCYNCGKYEHYASECSYKNDGHVNLVQASSSESKNSTLLLAHNDSSGQHDVGYLDSVEGRGKVRIFQKNSKEEFISDVYFVPSMKSNILSIGQLLQKGYIVHMENNVLSLRDTSGRLIARVQMTKNQWCIVYHKLIQQTTSVKDVYLCPTKCVKNMTHQEAWSGYKPSVAHLRIFWCVAYAQVPEAKRRKLDARGEKCIFIGYSEESKAYKLYNPLTNKVVVSRDVIFSEEEAWNLSSKEANKENVVSDESEEQMPVVTSSTPPTSPQPISPS